MSDVSDPTDEAARDRKPGASWFRIWWPALLICGIVTLGFVTGLLSSSLHGPHHGDAKTLNAINALAQAIGRFESEYGLLPDVHASDLETDSPQGAELITLLLGKEESGSVMQNPRQIPFLSIPTTRTKNHYGFYYSHENVMGALYDAWGNPLRILLRPPGQTAITLPYREKEMTISAPAAVLSRGQDGKWATKDDLTSWDLP